MGELDFMIWMHTNLHSSDVVTQIVKYITMLGDSGLVWIILGLVMLCSKKTRTPALFMLGSLALGFLINDFILKNLFARERPIFQSDVLYNWLSTTGYEMPDGFSFPSGHSMGSFACAIVLVYFYKWRATPAVVLASLIAISRVYMCAHFPTDVIAGALFGTIIAIIAIIYYKKFWGSFSRWLYKTKAKFLIYLKNKNNA